MIKKHLLIWFGIALLAVANGAARDLVYGEALGEFRAQQVSTVSLLLVISVVAWFAGARWPLGSVRAGLTVGECWMTMTVAFEFLLGGVILKKPWATLMRNYDISKGRLWMLVPLWLLVLPMLVVFLRARRQRAGA